MENEKFELTLQKQEQGNALTNTMVGREAQQIQGMVFMAKQFPRDEIQAYDKIMKSCSRLSLAEEATYEYPRGGQKISGPSVVLARTIARAWGNIDFGIVELDQKTGSSSMMAYAWDLETNTRETRIFELKHVRDKKEGGKTLTDVRDIYELTANMGARRERACILGLIPDDIVDAAVEKCKETLRTGNKKPLTDRIRDMIVAFGSDYQVNKEALEKYIGCKAEAFSENDFIRLKGVYKSLKDGMAKREDYFEFEKPTPELDPADEEFKKLKESKKTTKPEEEPQQDVFDAIKEASK